MCRSNSQGGRRCPACASPAAKKKALENRKKNRKTRAILKSHFKSLGMDETANEIGSITPAQIPDVMEKLSIPVDILGDIELPNAANAHPDLRDASDIVSRALAEAEAKNIKLIDDVKTMIDDTDLSIPDRNNLVAAFSDYISESVSGISYERSRVNEGTEHLFDAVCSLPLSDEYRDYKWWHKFREDVIAEAEKKKASQPHIKSFIANNSDDPDIVPYENLSEEAIKIRREITKSGVEMKLVEMGMTPPEDTGPDYIDNIYNLRLAMQSIGNMNSVYRLTGDFYAVENLFGYRIVHAPDGFSNLDRMTATPQRSKSLSQDYPDGVPENFGLTGLSDDEMKKIIPTLGEVGPEMISLQKQGKPMSEASKMMFTSGKNDFHASALGDLQSAHAYAHGVTYVQSRGILTDSPKPMTESEIRSFRTGVVSTGTIYDVDPEEIDDIMDRYNNSEYGVSAKAEEEIQKVSDALSLGKILTREEEKLVSKYTGSSYAAMADKSAGSLTWDNKPGYECSYEEIDGINEAVRKLNRETVTESRFVYRGMRVPFGVSPSDYADSMEPGEEVVMGKLTSTSHDYYSAESFAESKNAVLCAYLTSSGASIESMSEHSNEREVLIPAGEKFVYLGYGTNDDGTLTMFFSDEVEAGVQ